MTNQEIKKQVDEILIDFKPVFERHSGGAELVDIKEDGLVFKLLGHCQGCAMAPITFGLMLEQIIKEKLPQIKKISYTD